MQRPAGQPAIQIFPDDLRNIWQIEKLPNAQRQADLFVLLVGNLQPSPSEPIEVDVRRVDAEIGATIDRSGWSFVTDHLLERRLVIFGEPPAAGIRISLTMDGWARYEALQRETTESRTAFMAMKFGDPDLDRMFRDHFVPAVAATGFQLERLDTNPKPGLIDARMEVEIRAARFMIADLTHGNHGAYWEAGFAAGLGRPVFYTCEKAYFEAGGSHFDTSHHYTVLWEAAAAEKAVEELKAAIRRTLPTEAKLRDGD